MLVSNDNEYRKDNKIHLQGKVERGMRPASSWSCKWSSLSWNLEGRAMINEHESYQPLACLVLPNSKK